jgi:D-xylulose kinase
MPQDQLFVGIDSGTQGTKIVILSREYKRLKAQAYAAHQLNETPLGGREQEPRWWTAACEQAMSALLDNPDIDRTQIKAIGVSGQQHGLVPMDSQGEVIRPAKLWCDTETAPQCRVIMERAGGEEAVIDAVGNRISAGYTASKVLWLKEQEPENYARLNKLLLPHDYLNYWLTGQYKMEYGDASGTAFFDIRRRRWSETLLNAIDDSGRLQTCLPEIIAADEPCGQLHPQRSKAWGLSGDVLVSAGGGDNMMAAIGTGNVRSGLVTASLGTSGTIYAFSDMPVVDPQGELAAFCSSSNGWLPLVCTMNVTVATEQVRALLNLDLEAFNLLIEKASPCANGLLMIPFFNGERTPDLPMAKASLTGMTPLNFTPGNLARSAMEGATLGLRYGLSVMERNGIRAEEIRLVGGGAKSRVWRRMVADMFAVPVVTPKEPEAGALGAALQAMWCYCRQKEGKTSIEEICDRYIELDPNTRAEPDPQTSKNYKAMYARYLNTDNVLRPLNMPVCSG